MSKNEWLEREVLTFNGRRGDTSSDTFHVSADFEVQWESEASDFELVLHKGSGLKQVETRVIGLTAAGKGKKGYPRSQDEYFLQVTASGPWTVTVTEKAKEITYDYDLKVEAKIANPFDFPLRVSYDFADASPKTIEIESGATVTVAESVSLTDQEGRFDNARLLREVTPITIRSLLNISPEAEAARERSDANSETAKAEREAREAAQAEARREQMDQATAEYQTTDRAERRKDLSRKEREALELNRDAREAASARRRKLLTAGVITGVVGLGGGITLLAVGAPIRAQGKSEYDAVGSSGDAIGQTLLRQEANKKINRGSALMGTGAGLAVLGTVGAGILIGMALSKKSSPSSAWQPGVAPMLVKDGGGLIFSGSF
jgi:F0F1-type ATP synthase membrane subunit c/vacuolar-type H+-ATPase subunit K